MGSASSHDDDSDMYDEMEEYEGEGYDNDEENYYGSDNDMSIERDEDDISDADVTSLVNFKVSEAIPTKVADLKEIAALNVAIALWKHVNVPKAISLEIPRGSTWNSNLDSKLFDIVKNSTENLLAPKLVAGHIAAYVNVMRNEIREWVSYHFRKVFFNSRSDMYVYNYIYDLVWYSNGTINRRETARNLLTSLRLSEIEKYYLLCIYCMKDDFDRLSPLLRKRNVVDVLNFSDHPLIYYWNCHFGNTTLENSGVTYSGSPDVFMIQHGAVDNWPAKEYFFDRLNADEQVRMAIWLIDKYGLMYQRLVLMKLNESQRLHVYMDRAVKIMTFYINSNDHVEEIVAMWAEIRNLISNIQFATVFNLLLNVGSDVTVLENIWSTARAEFKDYFLNLPDQYGNIAKMLNWWIVCHEVDFFFTFIQDANENLKTTITEKRFFVAACEKLISADELSLLDRLLKSCLVDIQRVVKFKQYLAEEDYFVNRYLTLIIDGESAMLERLLTSFLPDPEDCARFKRNLVKRSCFLDRLQALISNCEFTMMQRLLQACLPESEELLKFKENFVKKEFFMNQSERFITDDRPDMLDKMLQIFFAQQQDIAQFKNKLVIKESFAKYCEKLVLGNKEATLLSLLNSYFLNAEELAKFKLDLVVNSNAIKSKCLSYYSAGNFKPINTLLSRFLSSFPGLMAEFKKNIIMSSNGMSKSVEFFEKNPGIFNKMISDGYLTADSVTEIKKTVIFSPFAVEKMKTMIQDGRLDRVKERFNQFLTSEEDKKTLKSVVVGKTEDLIRVAPSFFNKHSESIWQSLMWWWLGSEEAVQEFKRTLPVDEMVNEMLKCCVFERFHDKSLRLCRFKSNLVFVRLDRFLIWMFETPRKVKEYKMRRVDSYMNIETIRMLLKKKDDSYIRGVMHWFFEGDQQEINAFKSRNRGRKVIKII